jgi:hypothetical protein
MTKRKLILELCRREKGKKQVNVAQMTDVVNRLIEMSADFYESGEKKLPSPLGLLMDEAVKVMNKRAKKVKKR